MSQDLLVLFSPESSSTFIMKCHIPRNQFTRVSCEKHRVPGQCEKVQLLLRRRHTIMICANWLWVSHSCRDTARACAAFHAHSRWIKSFSPTFSPTQATRMWFTVFLHSLDMIHMKTSSQLHLSTRCWSQELAAPSYSRPAESCCYRLTAKLRYDINTVRYDVDTIWYGTIHHDMMYDRFFQEISLQYFQKFIWLAWSWMYID